MGACAAQVFPSVSAAKWACMKQKLADAGHPVTGDHGSFSVVGVDISWTYDAAGQKLTVQANLPFLSLVSCSTVNARIHELFDNSGCP